MNTCHCVDVWYVAHTSSWRNQTLRFRVMQFKIVGDPSPEAWSRVRRYAAWMRQVHLGDQSAIVGDTLYKLRQGLPSGGWFPALQDLSLSITESNLPYTDLFFSPHLKKISIYMLWSRRRPEVPHDTLAAVASTISALPTSALQSLSVDVGCSARPACFKDSLSSVVLRCGSSLTEFTSTVPLSDAATNHLIRLPRLRTWHIEGPPPRHSTSSLSLIFPPLTELTLGEGAARGWLSLWERPEDGASTMQDVSPTSRVKDSLKSLNIKDLSILIINTSLTSQIRTFRNLVHLWIRGYCPDEDEGGQCIFGLNNDDVTNLAVALPQLESLSLGVPCPKNTCATTVVCLLQISVHCVKLEELEIHFNSTSIVGDLKNISMDPQFQDLRSLPKCPLSCLYVNGIPLALGEPGLETVVDGMIVIFPSLTQCTGLEWCWNEVSERIRELRKLEILIADMCECSPSYFSTLPNIFPNRR